MSPRIEIAIVKTLVVLPSDTRIHDAIAPLLTENVGESSVAIAHTDTGLSSVWQHPTSPVCILTVESDQEDCPKIGIATDRDLMAALLRTEAQDTITLREVISPARLTCYRANLHDIADLRAIGQQMQQQGVTIVPVLDDRDRPIGLISTSSLLYALNPDILSAEISPTDAGTDVVIADTESVASTRQSTGETRPFMPIKVEDDGDNPTLNPVITTAMITSWRDHAARYRALFEDAHDAILIANLDGYITDVNHQAEILFGYSRHELIGLHQAKLHPPEDFDEISEKFQDVLRRNTDTVHHLRILCQHGIIKYVDIRGKIILVGDRPIIQGVFREVAQEKKIEDALQRVIIRTEEKQGTDFFVALAEAIAHTLNIDYVFLDELTDDILKPLAAYSHDNLSLMREYLFKNTPFEFVLKDGSFSCESSIQDQFPNDQFLAAMQAQSYVGIALLDQERKPIGSLSILHRKTIKNTPYILSILGIFAVRAATELERQRANQQLEKLNQNLQNTLVKRTHQLREQEHFLQTLLDLDSFPLSVFWKDINSVYLGCNQSFLRDANLQSLDDIIGRDDYAMPWGKTEAEAYRADDREVMESNQPKLGIIETQVQSDGRQIWLETNKMPFHDIDGNVIGVLGLYQDITDRKQSEYELQRISTRLNLAVQSANIGIWEWDVSTGVPLWNTQMFALYGLDPTLTQPNYDTWLNCLHADDRVRVHTATQQALTGEADYDIEFRIVRPDGEIRFLQAGGIVQRDAKGQPVLMVGVNYDITDLKHTEQRLRQQLETIEAAADGIAIFQGDRYVLMNPAHAKLFGYDQVDELLGQSWKILYEPEEQARFEQDILPALMRDGVWQGEAIGRRKDGSTFIEGLSLTVSKDGALICMCRDISENKRAEQQLRDAKEAAELADRAKSNFLALMSHEIRTPINGVLGLAHLLQQTELDEQQWEYLTRLSQSAQSLSQIVNDILDFSKIEADQLSLETIPFQLDEVLNRLKAVLELKASEKNLDFRVEIGATVPPCLVGDPLRLGQVAINLVSNAIKFTHQGGVMFSIEECDRHDTTTRLRFTVSDSGMGLNPAQITTLFQPFTQADPSISRRQGGTGLGLSICQRLVRLMGGEIEVESEPGKGSTFTFELVFEYDEALGRSSNIPLDLAAFPLESPHRSATLAPITRLTHPFSALSGVSSPDRPTDVALQGASILLVEDNDVNQLVARKILEQLGVTVDLAVNGRKAIAQVLNRQYDLILMDIQMPEMDGLEATRRIRRLSQLGHESVAYLKSVPIIAMTAHAFKSDQQRSLKAGMNDHLCKPIDPDILRQILTLWLDKHPRGKPKQPTPVHPVRSETTGTPPIARSLDPAFPFAGLIAPAIRSLSPDLDVVDGLARIYNDAQLYQDLLKLFVEIYEPFAATLHDAYQSQDRAQILSLLHTLKGAAANVSANKVVTQATQVLHLLRTQGDHSIGLRFDSGEIGELLRSLDVALSHIRHVLEMMTTHLSVS